jgi:hypothetical protein
MLVDRLGKTLKSFVLSRPHNEFSILKKTEKRFTQSVKILLFRIKAIRFAKNNREFTFNLTVILLCLLRVITQFYNVTIRV